MIGTVAQWLEQVTHNLRVAGSSPAGSTNPPHFPNYRRLPGSSIKKYGGGWKNSAIENF